MTRPIVPAPITHPANSLLGEARLTSLIAWDHPVTRRRRQARCRADGSSSPQATSAPDINPADVCHRYRNASFRRHVPALHGGVKAANYRVARWPYWCEKAEDSLSVGREMDLTTLPLSIPPAN